MPLARTIRPICATAIGATLAFSSLPAKADAALGPFGAGLPDSGLEGLSRFPRLFSWMIAAQTYFNEKMTSTVQAIARHDDSAICALLAVAFLYGVVHAIGPGHGKAVLSSYVMANRQTVRNGVVLAALAALAQSAAAVAFVWAATIALRLTSVAMTGVAYRLEIASDLLIVLLGLWLVYAKIVKRFANPDRDKLSSKLLRSGAPAQRGLACEEAPSGRWARLAARLTTRTPACACGALHSRTFPTSRALDWRDAWGVLGVTALRPCAGALILLVFAKVEGLFAIGVLAVFVMGLGVALTVAAIAVLSASLAKAAAAAGETRRSSFERMSAILEMGASIAVLVFGLLLLGSNLSLV